VIKHRNKPRSELFAHRIIDWQQKHGRHGLPWQGADVYRVWLSEIMLQQTQVVTVIPYYLRFVARFPTIAALAADSEDTVLAHWSGLGYYSRARNLHRAAQLIMQRHEGKFPQHFEDILALPGIGRSTAAAISAFAFHERCAILDGNVKRLLARYHAIEGYTGEKKIEAQLWQQAEALLPRLDGSGRAGLHAQQTTMSHLSAANRLHGISERTGRATAHATPTQGATGKTQHLSFAAQWPRYPAGKAPG
jgi:A/G-specific adenine glycosylase